jgi:hypothetical protein
MHRSLLACLLLSAATLHAQGPPSPEEIDALLVQSGIQRQIEGLPSLFENGILQSATDFDPQQVATLHAVVAKAFAGDRVRATVRAHLQGNLLREDVEKVALWHATPLGAKLRELELKSGDPAWASQQGDLATLVGAERLQRLERIDAATGATESTLLLLRNTLTSIARIKLLLSGVDPKVAADQTGRLAQLEAMAHRVALLSLADRLRAATDEELNQYIAFAESPSGRRWHRETVAALGLVMTQGLEEVEASLAGHRPQ